MSAPARRRYRAPIGAAWIVATCVVCLLALCAARVASAASGISFRSVTSASGAVGRSLTLAAPPRSREGDVMVATVAVRGAPAVSAPAGWKLIRTDRLGRRLRQSMYTHVVARREPARYTWRFSVAAGSSGAMADLLGVDARHPVDVSAGRAGRRGTQIVAPSLRTTRSGELLLAGVA